MRDAAHPCHAVMGLIGLNNSALQMGALRERDLGWSRDALIESLHAAAATGDADRMRHEFAWMEARIADALADVATDELVTDAEQTAPTPAVIARLRHAARDFDQSRDATGSAGFQPAGAAGSRAGRRQAPGRGRGARSLDDQNILPSRGDCCGILPTPDWRQSRRNGMPWCSHGMRNHGAQVRLISLRKATTREQERYFNERGY